MSPLQHTPSTQHIRSHSNALPKHEHSSMLSYAKKQESIARAASLALPGISLVGISDTEEELHLRSLLNSVTEQTLSNWHLTLLARKNYTLCSSIIEDYSDEYKEHIHLVHSRKTPTISDVLHASTSPITALFHASLLFREDAMEHACFTMAQHQSPIVILPSIPADTDGIPMHTHVIEPGPWFSHIHAVLLSRTVLEELHVQDPHIPASPSAVLRSLSVDATNTPICKEDICFYPQRI